MILNLPPDVGGARVVVVVVVVLGVGVGVGGAEGWVEKKYALNPRPLYERVAWKYTVITDPVDM